VARSRSRCLGRAVTNLRLPGQYDERLLGSLGLQGPYYNWNRWYLPGVGRYLELDPVAVAGGFNGEYVPDWFGYANGNPLITIDPIGLAIPDFIVRQIAQRFLRYLLFDAPADVAAGICATELCAQRVAIEYGLALGKCGDMANRRDLAMLFANMRPDMIILGCAHKCNQLGATPEYQRDCIGGRCGP